MGITLLTNDKFENERLNALLKDRFSYIGFHTCSESKSFASLLEIYPIDIILFGADIEDRDELNTILKSLVESNQKCTPKVIFLSQDPSQTKDLVESLNQEHIKETFHSLIEKNDETRIIATLMKLLSSIDTEKKLKAKIDDKPVQSGSMQQQVLDSMPMKYFWKDRHSVYVGCNLPFAKLAGLNSPEEIVGLCDYDLSWSRDESDFFVSYDRKIMETGNSEIGLVEPISGPDGVEHWIETSKIPFRNDDGEIEGVIGAFIDVSEKIKLQQENIKKEKLNVLAQVAGGIAHDINNCLTIVLGFTDIALKGRIEESEFMKTFQRIDTAGKKAIEIGKKLMAFTKEDHTFMSILDIKEFFDLNIPILHAGLGMDIDLEITNNPSKVIFDSSMLYQVVSNLITNASQADSKEKRFEIKLSQVNLDETNNDFGACGEYVIVECKDFAGGMKDTVLENIFQPYFTTKSGGNGLGLASCKKIMEAQNGYLIAKTQLGEGSVFSLYIPVATKENSKKYIQFSKDLIKGEGLVLFLEDDSNLALVNIDLISETGHDVKYYPSVEELLLDERAIQRACAVVTDFKFDEGMYNGLDLLNLVKSKRSDLPIILLSSYIDKVGAIEQFDYGLQKPLEIQKLSQVLSHLKKSTTK